MGTTGEELERLSGLLEKGLITREEFPLIRCSRPRRHRPQ